MRVDWKTTCRVNTAAKKTISLLKAEGYKPPCGEPDWLMSQVQTTHRANRATGLFCVPTKAWCLHLGAAGFKLITLCNEEKGGSSCEHRRATSCDLTGTVHQSSRCWIFSVLWDGWSDQYVDPQVNLCNHELSSCSLLRHVGNVWPTACDFYILRLRSLNVATICETLFFSPLLSQQRARTGLLFDKISARTPHKVTQEGHPNLQSPTNSFAALSKLFFLKSIV